MNTQNENIVAESHQCITPIPMMETDKDLISKNVLQCTQNGNRITIFNPIPNNVINTPTRIETSVFNPIGVS